eukprot:5090573-Amphidinium_carterae.1
MKKVCQILRQNAECRLQWSSTPRQNAHAEHLSCCLNFGPKKRDFKLESGPRRCSARVYREAVLAGAMFYELNTM